MSDLEASERARLLASSQRLFELLVARVPESAHLWLAQHLSHETDASFFSAYATAGRKLGASPLALIEAEQTSLERLTYPHFGLGTVCDLGRSCLLLTRAATVPFTQVEADVIRLYYKGDANEQRVILRCLALLPKPSQYALIATDAARSHVQPVFESLACENPYASRYLDDAAFNQIVMKAFFIGVEVRRIHDLSRRNNAELRRMAVDFASERRAAGRPVPRDLDDVVNAP